MKTKDKLKNKTLLTMYFRKEEAERLVEVLNKAHRRYEFVIENGSEGTYDIYIKYNIGSKESIKEDILWFLLDRIAYDLAK